MEKFVLSTNSKVCFIDITEKVKKVVKEKGIKDGFAVIFIPHTTAGIAINENADKSVCEDIKNHLEKLVPSNFNYLHGEGNSPAHIKSLLTANSQTIIIDKGELKLGTWQGIFFLEFDGPRQAREVWIKVFSEIN